MLALVWVSLQESIERTNRGRTPSLRSPYLSDAGIITEKAGTMFFMSFGSPVG